MSKASEWLQKVAQAHEWLQKADMNMWDIKAERPSLKIHAANKGIFEFDVDNAGCLDIKDIGFPAKINAGQALDLSRWLFDTFSDEDLK